jgi:hypothetical protein
MPFCPHCGGEADQLPAAAAAELSSDEVEIARIQADRDVEVAKIQARQDRDYNETRVEVAAIEGEAEVGAAEAQAEVIGEIIAAETGTGEEGEQPPAVITAEPQEPDTGEELAPPVVESRESGPRSKPGWVF